LNSIVDSSEETKPKMRSVALKLQKVRSILLIGWLLGGMSILAACTPLVNSNTIEELQITSAVFSISPEGTLVPGATHTTPLRPEDELTADEVDAQEAEQFLIVAAHSPLMMRAPLPIVRP